MIEAKGYEQTFLGRRLKVPLPQPHPSQKKDLAPVNGSRRTLLHYLHFSVALSKTRKLALFTAVNIDSTGFRNIKRESLFPGGSDRWEVDERAEEFQWGPKLYSGVNSDFDKGHMVKREDPQWGEDDVIAAEAARSTFFYSNCAPQVPELNREEWRGLEDYILKKEAAPHKLRVCVFTGPVLSDSDPVFIHPVEGQEVQIPTLFWKLVYFTADGKTLNRVAFLMGQKKLLFKRRLVRKKEGELEAMGREPVLFTDFKDAATYQVNVNTVERLTRLSFPEAFEPFRDARPSEIVKEAVEVSDLERFLSGDTLGYELKGLRLR